MLRFSQQFSGGLIWQKCLGGTDNDGATSVVKTLDGRYLVTGATESLNKDVTINHGSYDYWVVKLDPFLDVPAIPAGSVISIVPNPTRDLLSINGTGPVNIRVYDVTGRLVKEAAHTNSISVASMPTGVYVLKLSDSQGRLVYQDKIVKE